MESVIERNMRIGADYKRAMFMVKQKQPYEFKKNYAAIRAREFVGMCDEHGKNYHVSVGGLDSITLFLFLHSIGIRDNHKENAKNISKTAVTLAVYIMEAINDYVYKLDPKKSTMPIIIAGVAAWVELMRGTLDENETKKTDLMIEAVVNSSIVCEKEKGEDDEEDD